MTTFLLLLSIPWHCTLCKVIMQDSNTGDSIRPFKYPTTRQVDQVDDYHGTPVADPYRWLEDTDSDETESWIDAQNAVTSAYLAENGHREQVRERLRVLWDYERFGIPRRRGNRYFFTRNDGLQNQSVLYVSDSLASEPRPLLDPNSWSDDGTAALAGWAPSEDGNLLAYGIAESGSDWRKWKVIEVASGEERPDKLDWVKFSGVSWSNDGSGLYYSRYDAPAEGEEFSGVNYFQKLYFHKLGDAQDDDQLVYQRPDEKEWGFGGQVSEDGDYLVISVWRGSEQKNQIFYQPLDDPHSEVVELITGFESEYDFIGNEGSVFWFNTDDGAPLRRVIAVDITHPEREHWTEILAESDSLLEGVGLVGDRFLASYLRNASSQIRVFDLQGQFIREVNLPGIGTANGFGGRRGHTETFYAFSNFTTPGTIYRYEIATGESSTFRAPKVAFDSADYVTEQVFVTSRDGTRVPMFLTHRRGLQRDGTNPTILYGYGGFNISLTPQFSVTNLVWVEMGGILAVPNLRGGGEFGRHWHEAGMKDRKQNVFDDFLSAAEWLIGNQYTSAKHLAIRGGSNGGLLVGAAMTQRPELFAAAVPAVGVMDMLRFHKFTIGWAWVGEYGSSDDAAEFPTLLAYSPLHNLRPGTEYPATMVTTADHDDRVVPGHSFKFAAALQAAHKGDRPVLIRIESRAGHGAGTPTAKLIDAAADMLSFVAKEVELQATIEP